MDGTNRFNSTLAAVAFVLLSCTLVVSATEGQNPQPTVTFATVPKLPEATRPFDVNLTVQIDPLVVYTYVYGYFSVLDSAGSVVRAADLWYINFDGSYPRTKGEYDFLGVVVPSSGTYILWTDVTWRDQHSGNWHTDIATESIYVAPAPTPVQSYSVEWLKPISLGKPFKAGSTIKIKFSVFDSNSYFRHDESVRVTVTDRSGSEVFTAVYSEGENPVRIKDSTECYVVYWKTEKGMSGEYTITVTFANAQVTTPPETVTIRP